jgi:hypothetical protein
MAVAHNYDDHPAVNQSIKNMQYLNDETQKGTKMVADQVAKALQSKYNVTYNTSVGISTLALEDKKTKKVVNLRLNPDTGEVSGSKAMHRDHPAIAVLNNQQGTLKHHAKLIQGLEMEKGREFEHKRLLVNDLSKIHSKHQSLMSRTLESMRLSLHIAFPKLVPFDTSQRHNKVEQKSEYKEAVASCNHKHRNTDNMYKIDVEKINARALEIHQRKEPEASPTTLSADPKQAQDLVNRYKAEAKNELQKQENAIPVKKAKNGRA